LKNFSKYLVFTGPESSGKTTLAGWLASSYKMPLVPEYARIYIDQLHRPYRKKDLLVMAKGQLSMECQNLNESMIVCDSDLLTFIIWFEVKYGLVPDWIINWFIHAHRRYYFLCAPDVPWEFDPQRENPDDRDFLFNRYVYYLQSYDKDFIILRGNLSERKKMITNYFSNGM
jgi:nicotinamide riboside kinase